MPARLLQSLSVTERGVSFQDHRFLVIEPPGKSSSTLYMMSCITFL